MACPIMRKYPPKQPPDWKPPVPRWQLVFPTSAFPNISAVHTVYVGIQSHASVTFSKPDDALTIATTAIKSWLVDSQPAATDAFVTETDLAHDVLGSRVWVAYFTSQSSFNAALDALDLVGIYNSTLPNASAAGNANGHTNDHDTSTPKPPSQESGSIGLWTEIFTTPISRLETNYAGLHEKPGLANITGTEREYHELSAYWGAARDRIPASAEDLFPVPGSRLPEMAKTGQGCMEGGANGVNGGRAENGTSPAYDDLEKQTKQEAKRGKHGMPHHITDDLSTSTSDAAVQFPSPSSVPRGFGQRLVGSSYDNMAHIRSGQCWDQCPEDEAAAYTREGGLQEKLMKGMEYLWRNPEETGTLGLRWLRNVVEEGGVGGEEGDVRNGQHSNGNGNVDAQSSQRKAQQVRTINETCGAGFFRNLKDLENWSSTHPSHMAIFTGAHKHAREWGKHRKFMTWHEVSVLKKGEARWEYVNCDPRTGVVRYVKMEEVEALSGKPGSL
jgi:hypothetical protein